MALENEVGKEKKMLVTSIFSFSRYVFKCLNAFFQKIVWKRVMCCFRQVLEIAAMWRSIL